MFSIIKDNPRIIAQLARVSAEAAINKIKPAPRSRAVALLATYNEERFIRSCIENLINQRVNVYLIDNCSTDRTVEIAREYSGRGLIGIEHFPREDGVYHWQAILRRKEELASTLDADWFIHVDADEIHLPPRPGQTLAAAFAAAEHQGYNAVDYDEFVFIPTREHPDHDHPNYMKTMRWYYPLASKSGPRLIRAWKRQKVPVRLSGTGGHRPDFPGMRLYPLKFRLKHYLFLSPEHLLEKYAGRTYDREELERGWHGWRAKIRKADIDLPSQNVLKPFITDGLLDPSNPRRRHIAARWTVKRE
ncbi:glycosyltransferase family A protein [Rubrobacter naiadicus]|uniref:glycosyltransferase family A protein n=1 Tax=Rubrobacter naiadicus TaxID=1392641 RepID=UPI00236012B2|nr:glycosyltransferase family 2 protein [Rubrobacter naiadicus]